MTRASGSGSPRWHSCPYSNTSTEETRKKQHDMNLNILTRSWLYGEKGVNMMPSCGGIFSGEMFCHSSDSAVCRFPQPYKLCICTMTETSISDGQWAVTSLWWKNDMLNFTVEINTGRKINKWMWTNELKDVLVYIDNYANRQSKKSVLQFWWAKDCIWMLVSTN